MKILLVITSGTLGGAQRYVSQIAHDQKIKGNTVEIICGPKGTWLEKNLKDFPFHRLPLFRSWNPLKSLLFLWSFNNYLKKNRPCLVHFNSSNTFIGLWITKWLNIPSLVTLHGLSLLQIKKKFSLQQWMYFLFLKITLPFADHLSFVSQADQHQTCLLFHFLENKTSVIYPGVYFSDFLPQSLVRQQLNLPKDALIIGNLGRFEFQKNQKLFLSTFASLQNTSLHACLIGEGSLEIPLQTQIEKLSLQDRVHLRKGDASYLPLFDIFVLTSCIEGFPYVLLEAASAGIPLISTNVGGIAEFIEDGVNGILVPQEENALCKAIEKLLCSETTRKNFVEKARQKCQNEFLSCFFHKVFSRSF